MAYFEDRGVREGEEEGEAVGLWEEAWLENGERARTLSSSLREEGEGEREEGRGEIKNKSFWKKSNSIWPSLLYTCMERKHVYTYNIHVPLFS